METCRETGREELFGVRAVAGSAHFLRDREIEIKASFVRRDVAVSAGAGGESLGGVEGFHGCFLSRDVSGHGVR